MGGVLYNENDKRKAAWLRHLIEEGAIAHGVVDERSIAEVQADDLRGFVQVHAFAGVGLWSLCLRRAGWPDDRPVWTGSCPCGPFSKAGLRQGFEDPRHLWPEWFRLIGECRPSVLFGEQSDEALEWLDLVSSDLEGSGYAIGSDIVPAAGFQGRHERHRIGFVADADNAEWWSDRAPWHDGFWPKTGRVQGDRDAGNGREDCGLADTDAGRQSQQQELDGPGQAGRIELGSWRSALRRQHLGGLVHASGGGCRVGPGGVSYIHQPDRSGNAEWLRCRDGLWRPIEPGLSPLIDADSARMGLLRGYGDAIDVEAFTNLIGAYMDAAPARGLAA